MGVMKRIQEMRIHGVYIPVDIRRAVGLTPTGVSPSDGGPYSLETAKQSPEAMEQMQLAFRAESRARINPDHNPDAPPW